MSGLHFKVDCLGRRSVCVQTDIGRACRGAPADAPARRLCASESGGLVRVWRRKPETFDAQEKFGRKRLVASPMVPRMSGTSAADDLSRGRACIICCPSQFFCDEFARRIDANRAHEKQRWIFDLIAGNAAPKEEVFVDRPLWMLVRGSSYCGSDVRYLVIFKDLALHTIRDLRRTHLPMLYEMRRYVRVFLQEQHGHNEDFRLYFHYMPSVFQLHLHVCCESAPDSSRTQLLSCVVRNIETRDTWYRDALILFCPPRAARVGGAATTVSAIRVPDKPGDVCI